MKIGLVLSNPPAYSETFFNSKIKGLIENGFEVILYVQKGNPEFELCNVVTAPKVHVNPVLQLINMLGVFLSLLSKFSVVKRYIVLERNEQTSWFNLLKKIYLNAHMLKSNVDCLHFGFATQAIGSELVAKAINAKMAVSFRGFDIGVYPIKHPNCYDLLWREVNKVHVISEDILQLCYENGMPNEKKYLKITPAIDVVKFNHCIVNNTQIDTKLNFLTVGRLHWKKGYTYVIEALALLKNAGWDFTYTIVGEGNDYERIAYTAYSLGIYDNIIFKGKLPVDLVVCEYEKATVYLQYSIQEGFCNTVLEAQAMGKLCIVSNAEGLPENIEHEKTGWVVPKCDVKSLALKIREVIALSDDSKTIVRTAARTRVELQFTIEQQQQKFVEFYKTL